MGEKGLGVGVREKGVAGVGEKGGKVGGDGWGKG